MRRVVAILVLFAALPAVAAWEEMVSRGGIALFLDPQTVRPGNGNTRSVVALVAYSEPLANGVRSVRGTMEYDCGDKRLRTLTFTQYTEPLARGRVVSDSQSPTEWSPVVPETFAADALNFVCKR